MRDRIGGQLHEFARQDVALLMVDAGAHVADGIDGEDRQMITIDVDADRKEGVGVDLKLDCRLPSQTVAPASFDDQAFIEQAIDDAGDRRLGEAGLPGDFRTRNRCLPVDATQNDGSGDSLTPVVWFIIGILYQSGARKPASSLYRATGHGAKDQPLQRQERHDRRYDGDEAGGRQQLDG
jgi:hypothetical protein